MLALFVILVLVSVGSAVLMLASEDAIHSALFLIINFVCVAIMYLMLDAPFLAMIQIAVYAGAIMVLFLFVIMLLGAEKLTAPARRFRWLSVGATALAGIFAVVAAYVITNSKIDLTPGNPSETMLRVVHAAPYTGPVDVYANGELFASDVNFGEATAFKAVTPGEYSISLNPAGTANPVQLVSVTIAGDTTRRANTFTVIAFGGTRSLPPNVGLLPDNLEPVDARTGRVTIFNAYQSPINVVDFGSDGDAGETDPAKRDDRVVVADIQSGSAFTLPLLSEGLSLRSWALTDVDANQPDLAKLPLLTRLDNPQVYSIKRDTAQLWVVATESLFDGSTREVAIPVVSESISQFGGPSAVGELLFSQYMLPFQLIAILLLAAMVGAIVLTHKEGFQPRRRDVRRRVMKPLSSVIADQVGHDVSGEDLPRLPESQPEAIGD
ncbi:MAG: NADH-quinone oxidoreductase subunit J [Anaerolineae bacterium]